MQSMSYAEFLGRYKVRQKIGEGSFGQVFRVFDCETKQYMALKKIVLRRNEDPMVFLRQIQIQTFLAHSLVLKIFEFYIYQAHDKYLGHKIQIGIITELGKNSLLHLIKDKSYEFPIQQIINFAYHFTKLFAFFQDQKCVHRDIKPENFVQVGPGLQCKLIDFGLCSHVNDINGVAGSFCYLSPKLKKMHSNRELRNKIKTNPFKDDVYSFGLTLYELITRKTPQYRSNEVNRKYSTDIYNCTQNQKLAKIVQLMLEYEEEHRPDFHQLFQIFNNHWTFYQEDYENNLEDKNLNSYEKQRYFEKIEQKQFKCKKDQKYTEKTVKRRQQDNNYEKTCKFKKQPNEYEYIENFEEGKSVYYVDKEVQQMKQRRITPLKYIKQYEKQQSLADFKRKYLKNKESQIEKSQWQRPQSNNFQVQQYNTQETKTIQIDKSINQFQYNNKTEVINEKMQVSNNQSVAQHQNQQKPQAALNKKNYNLPPNIIVTSIIMIKQFIICGCQDGSIQVINTSSTKKKNIYKIVGANHLHQTLISAINKDRFGRLWTVSIDGKLIMWDRLKFFKHLINQSYYREEEIQIINSQGQRQIIQRGLIEMDSQAGTQIYVPDHLKSGVTALYCHDEKNFVLGFKDGNIFAVWENISVNYSVHNKQITTIKIYQNGLITSSLDGTIRILDLNTMNLKNNYFKCRLQIRNFSISGTLQQPNFTIVTTDGRGYVVNNWQLSQHQEGQNDGDDVNVTAAFFANDFVFTLTEKGTILRNGQLIENCQGHGWCCMSWDNWNSMVLGSNEGRLVLLQCE